MYVALVLKRRKTVQSGSARGLNQLILTNDLVYHCLEACPIAVILSRVRH